MRIAISGATGYLGSKLIGHFCSEGHHVLALARNITPSLSALAGNSDGLLELCDTEADEMLFNISRFGPDTIFSTTCCYETDAKFLNRTVAANYLFPAKLLKYCMQINGMPSANPRIRFISIGTSLPENLNLYSLTKKQFDDLGRFFAEIGKIQFVNVLLESFYGPDEPENRFIRGSISKLLRNESLEVTEGTQRRDYISVGDVIEILYFLGTSRNLTENYYSVPVGTGNAPSIREILDFLHTETRSQSKILYGARPMRKNEPSTCADLSTLRKLGYGRELVSWQDGMRMMINKIIRTGE